MDANSRRPLTVAMASVAVLHPPRRSSTQHAIKPARPIPPLDGMDTRQPGSTGASRLQHRKHIRARWWLLVLVFERHARLPAGDDCTRDSGKPLGKETNSCNTGRCHSMTYLQCMSRVLPCLSSATTESTHEAAACRSSGAAISAAAWAHGGAGGGWRLGQHRQECVHVLPRAWLR